MESISNNNNDNEAPLTSTTKTIQNLNMTSGHPLQDVPLTGHENISEMQDQQQQQQQNVQSKKNWVKFDDDANEISSSTSNNTNNNNKSQNNYDQTDSTARATSSVNQLTTSQAALLPPPPQTTSRPRTPIEREKSQTQLQREPVTTSPLNGSPTPVQRSIVSSTTAAATLTTESTHVNLNASGTNSSNNGTTKATIPVTTTTKTTTSATNNAMHHKSHQQQHHPHHQQHSSAATTASPVEASTSMTSVAAGPPPMRTIELSTGRIREGFANGDVIVTLLPANTKWPWITPAIFRPELVPEELMAQGLTLTVEEYVQAMEVLVNDYRFTVYNICYKRVLVCWILFAFAVLLALLFSGLQGVALFSLGVCWLFLNAAAIFFCMWVKLRLARGLEKCLARVNRQLMKHKILLILDDRGRISCHKVNLCFLYFDSTQCINYLNEFLEQTEQNGGEAIKAGWESKLDIDLNDIVIQGSTPVRLSRKQAVAQELYLSYIQRWGKDFLRRRLDWTVQEAGVHETPRHLQSSICPCQYEEELLRNKIKLHLRRKQCCGIDCLGCWL